MSAATGMEADPVEAAVDEHRHTIAVPRQRGREMAATVTWDTLRELAGFRSPKACALSMYLDLHPSETPTASDAETRLNSLLTEAEHRANTKDYGHEQKVALKADLDRVRSWWDSEFDREGARGLAL